MKVIFVKDVDNAKVGDVKEVADGYARNFLLPRGLARPATAEQMKILQVRREAESKRVARELAEAQALATQIEGLTLQLVAKAGAQKRLHGSVTAKDVVDGLKAQHQISLDRHDVELDESIKRLGEYTVPIRLGHGLEPKLKVIVAEA